MLYMRFFGQGTRIVSEQDLSVSKQVMLHAVESSFAKSEGGPRVADSCSLPPSFADEKKSRRALRTTRVRHLMSLNLLFFLSRGSDPLKKAFASQLSTKATQEMIRQQSLSMSRMLQERDRTRCLERKVLCPRLWQNPVKNARKKFGANVT